MTGKDTFLPCHANSAANVSVAPKPSSTGTWRRGTNKHFYAQIMLADFWQGAPPWSSCWLSSYLSMWVQNWEYHNGHSEAKSRWKSRKSKFSLIPHYSLEFGSAECTHVILGLISNLWLFYYLILLSPVKAIHALAANALARWQHSH